MNRLIVTVVVVAIAMLGGLVIGKRSATDLQTSVQIAGCINGRCS